MSENGIEITSRPPDLKDLLSVKICTRGTKIRTLYEHTQGEFSIGSMVFDCDDYAKVWNILAQDLNSDTITALVNLNHKTQERTGEKCLHSLYSMIFCSFLEKNFAAQVSQTKLLFFFCSHIRSDKSVFVDQPFSNCYIDNWLNVFCSLQNIAAAVETIDQQANMLVYMKCVDEVVKHQLWVQHLVEEAINLRCGPLMHLATRVTQENINWFMSKLKLTSSVNFLQQLFCAPSVMGKCAALFQLLEIHEVLWKSINVGKIEALIPTLYNILDWIFEKCVAFKDYVVEGFKWVKARFRRSPNESDKYPTLKKDLPDTPEAAPQMSKEQNEVAYCLTSKQEFVLNILNGVVIAQSDNISYSNNCFFESIASHLLADPRVMREIYYKTALEDPEKFKKSLKTFGLNDEAIESEFASVIKSIAEGLFIGVEAIPFAEIVFDCKIIAYTQIEGQEVAYITDQQCKNDKWVVIRNDSCHWISCDYNKKAKFINILGEEVISLEEQEAPKPVDPIQIIEAKVENKEEVVVETQVEPDITKDFVEDLKKTEDGRSFLDWLRGMCKDVYEFFRKNAIIGGAIAFCFSIASACGIAISKFRTWGDKRSFWENISAVSKDFYYLSRGQDAFCKVFSDFGVIFRNLVGVDDAPEITAFKESLVKAADEADKINGMCQHNPDVITNDPQQLREMKIKLDNIRARYHELTKFSPTVNLQILQPIWQRLTNSYTQLCNFHMQFCNSCERRVRPVCVWIWGKSNLGKSELCQYFVNEINRKQGTAWQVFTVSKGPDYLNGYRQQKIILIDDFDSFTSVEGCLDALLVMNMVTSAPYNPNMAAIEEKNLQANPSLLLIASNFQTAKLNCGVNDFLAFERRRNFVVNVTWPDHAQCDVTNDHCEHWQAVNKRKNELGRMNFDHLTLKKNHPLVYSNNNVFKKFLPSPVPKGKSIRDLDPSQVVEIGEINIDKLVDDTIDLINEYQKNFEFQKKEMEEIRAAALKKTAKAQSDECQNTDIKDWEKEPNIILHGPPGTGKSKVFEKVRQFAKDKKRSVKYIVSLDEFNAGASSNWFYKGFDIVLFDDYTTIKDSEHVKKFWASWKNRADQGEDSIVLWVLGMNDIVAMNSFDTIEEYEVVTRADRAYPYTFKFRLKPQSNIFYQYFKSELFTSSDVHHLPNGMTYADVVEIRKHGNIKWSHDNIVADILDWFPKRKALSGQFELRTIGEVKIDAICEIPKSTSEFVSMMNGSASTSETLSLIANASFKSDKFNKLSIGKRVYKTFMQLTQHHGTNFPNMDSFILTGVNNGYFNNFTDGNFVISFADAKYALIPVNDKVTACKYVPKDAAKDLSNIVSSVSETINTLDFLKVARSSLPPWFVLATSCIEQIIKFSLTGLFTSHVISQNTVMFEAVSAHQRMISATQEHYVKSTENSAAKFEKMIGSPETTSKKKKSFEPIAYKEDESDARNDRQSKAKQVRPRLRLRKRMAQGKPQFDITSTDAVSDFAAAVAESAVDVNNLPETVYQQISTDVAVYDSIGATIKNFVSITNINGKHLVYGLMIRGKMGTTVAHLLQSNTPSQLFVVDCDGNKYTMEQLYVDKTIDRFDFQIHGNKDFRDITAHISRPENTYFEQKLGILVNLNVHSKPVIMSQRFYRLVKQTNVHLKDAYAINSWSYTGGLSGFTTEIPPQTKDGDCGSVMFLCDANRTAKIIGLHVAANSTEGFFRTLDTSHIQASAQSAIGSGPLREFTEPLYSQDKQGFPVVAKCVERVFLPEKTHIYRSPFAFGDCAYEPSVLSKEDPRAIDIDDMVYKESMKWLKPQPVFTVTKLEQIKQKFTALGDYLGQKLNAYGLKTFVLTKIGALNSVKGFTHSQPIPVGTSPGYPFNRIVTNGKRQLISVNDATGERRFTNDAELKSMLHNAIDHVLLKADHGDLADVVYCVFAKDELLKKEKLSHKTRTIAAAPIHLVIALRMYFHTHYAALAEIWNVIPIKIGIAPNSSDWHSLAIRLFAVSNMGFSIDQTDFDFNIPQEVTRSVIEAHIALAEHTNSDLTPIIINRMRGLHRNITDFRIAVNGLVYEVTGGVPSGHPGTAPENSLISMFFMYDAFCNLAPSYYAITLETFFQVVALAIVGDDVIVAVHNSIQDWFNLIRVAEYLNQTYELKITTADKSKIDYGVKPLEELTFISRGFKRLDNQWVGPLEMKRLMKPFHFCHGTRPHHYWKEPDKITNDVSIACAAARSALDEMFLHGEKEYERTRRHCLKVAASLGNSEAYFPPYSEKYRDYFDVPENSVQGLHVYNFPLFHDLVSILTKQKGWFKYKNRRCILFGEPYSWDNKSAQVKPAHMPFQLRQVLNRVNHQLHTDFNQILVNEYSPNGEIPWHKDDEDGIDFDEGVACITLIGDGVVKWRNLKGEIITRLECFPALCYYMFDDYLKVYQHSRSTHTKYTISLTFRKIVSSG